MSGRTALYRLYGVGDVLLYIGITATPAERWRQHAADKPWWPEVRTREVEWFPDRESARRAEVEAIRRERPRHNIAETPMHAVVSRPAPRDGHMSPEVEGLARALREVKAIEVPMARAKVATEVLGILSTANGMLAKARRDDVRTMRSRGLSHREIGRIIGVHFTRVKQIEAGVPTGNSARARSARAEPAD